MGERTALREQMKSTDWIVRGGPAEGSATLGSPFPMQCRDQREQPPRRVKIDLDLVLESFDEQSGSFVVQAAPAHVDRLDFRGRARTDRAVIAVAQHEIIA